jgi:hypothetical protein
MMLYLGYIKNYEWSARLDGGYDCKTEIISVGEIIESLKINYIPNYLTSLTGGVLLPSKAFDSNRESTLASYYANIKTFYEKNVLAGLLSELIYYGLDKTKNGQTQDGEAFVETDLDGTVTGEVNHIMHFFRVKLDAKNGASSGESMDKIPEDEQVYVDLDTFVRILNQHVIVHDNASHKPLVPISLYDRIYLDRQKELYCLSYPLQISVDPTICLIRTDRYFHLDNLIKGLDSTISSGSINTAISDNVNIEVRSEAYKTIREYNRSSFKGTTDESQTVSTLDAFYNRFESKFSFKQLSGFLADAFEDYKLKTLKINREVKGNVSTLSYEVGRSLLHEEVFISGDIADIESNSVTRTQKIEAQRVISDSTFNDILIRDLHEDDEHLADFFKRRLRLPSAPDDNKVRSLTRENFSPDPNVFKASKEEVNRLMQSESANLQLQIITNVSNNNLSFMGKLSKDYFTPVGNKEFGSIAGIYINLKYALSQCLSQGLEEQDLKEKKEINLYDYIKSLLKGIQESIGNLNNFEVHVDPIDNIARIIDIHYIDEKTTEDSYNNAFTFLSDNPYGLDTKLDGLFNNIRKYKISSQIFKEQSAIVAISAQNGGGEMGLIMKH